MKSYMNHNNWFSAGEELHIKKRNKNQKEYPTQIFPVSITDSITQNWSGHEEYSYISSKLLEGTRITTLNNIKGEKSTLQKSFEKDFDFIDNVIEDNYRIIHCAVIQRNEERQKELDNKKDAYTYDLRWRVKHEKLFNHDYKAEKPTEVTIKVKVDGDYHGHKKTKKVTADEYFLFTETIVEEDGVKQYEVSPIKIYVTDNNMYLIANDKVQYNLTYNKIINQISDLLNNWVTLQREKQDDLYINRLERKLGKLEEELITEKDKNVEIKLQQVKEKEKVTN